MVSLIKLDGGKSPYNKLFKSDSQRVAFSFCVGFCDYGVVR